MPREKTQFKKGNKLATGGARKGAGRPAGWLQQVCDQEMDKRGIAELRAKIAAGEVIVTFYKDAKGKKKPIVRIPSLKDMQEAGDWLADRAQGKPTQPIKAQTSDGIDLVSLIRQAEDERGLARSV